MAVKTLKVANICKLSVNWQLNYTVNIFALDLHAAELILVSSWHKVHFLYALMGSKQARI